MTQLDAGISGGKAHTPLACWSDCADFHPGAYFVAAAVSDVRYPLEPNICRASNAEDSTFSDVQPTAVFRRIHELQTCPDQRARPFAGAKPLVQSSAPSDA